MKFNFSRQHAEFISETFHIDPNKDMSVDEQLDIEDALSELLQIQGFDGSGNENEIGTICADILTFIARND